MTREINIGIAEDHPTTRLGLVSALNGHKDIRVLFDVSNGKELLDKLKTLKPEILLLDIEMPVMRAQDVLEKINSKYPKIKVIILSAFFLEEYIIETFRLGVKAFLPKGDPIEKILDAIKTVHKGEIYTDPEVVKILASDVQNRNKKSAYIHFTTKELEIIKLICSGLSRQEAADKQKMTLDGLNYHMRKIMHKTGTKKRKELINYALSNGLYRP